MTSMEMLRKIKLNIDKRMSEIFESTVIQNKDFFLNKNGVPFRVCVLPPDILVIEYADTWEDGDCFYLEDGEENIFNAMMKELKYS